MLQLCEIDEKQYNIGPLKLSAHYRKTVSTGANPVSLHMQHAHYIMAYLKSKAAAAFVWTNYARHSSNLHYLWLKFF